MNRKLFDKGSVPRWSKLIHIIEETKSGTTPSYKVNDEKKWYKWFELQNIKEAESAPMEKQEKEENVVDPELEIKAQKVRRGLRRAGLVEAAKPEALKIINQTVEPKKKRKAAANRLPVNFLMD